MMNLWFISCSKPDEFYKDLLANSDRNYPGKLQNIVPSNGYYRFKLNYIIPPNNSAAKIVLAGVTDTIIFDIPNEKSGLKDSLYVDKLKETSYRFSIYTLNKKGESSIKQNILFKIYGDRYKSSLSTLNVKSKFTAVGSSDLRLIFFPDNANILVTSMFQYTDVNNQVVDYKIMNPKDTVFLINYKTGSDIHMINGFIPNKGSIDTIFTQKKLLKLP